MSAVTFARDDGLRLLALVEDAHHDLLSPRHHDLGLALGAASRLLGDTLFPPSDAAGILVGEMLRLPTAARRFDLETLDLLRRIDAGMVPLHRNDGVLLVAIGDLPGDVSHPLAPTAA